MGSEVARGDHTLPPCSPLSLITMPTMPLRPRPKAKPPPTTEPMEESMLPASGRGAHKKYSTKKKAAELKSMAAKAAWQPKLLPGKATRLLEDANHVKFSSDAHDHNQDRGACPPEDSDLSEAESAAAAQSNSRAQHTSRGGAQKRFVYSTCIVKVLSIISGVVQSLILQVSCCH